MERLGLDARIVSALNAAGIHTLSDLKRCSPHELGMIPKIGRDSVRSILAALANEPAMTPITLKIEKLQKVISKHQIAIAEVESEIGRLRALLTHDTDHHQLADPLNACLEIDRHDFQVAA